METATGTAELPPSPVTPSSTPSKSRNQGGGSSKKDKPSKSAGPAAGNKEPTKVVIRRLPPTLPEEVLKKTLEKWLPDTDWWYFVPGKLSKQKSKESQFSRAYLHFKSLPPLIDFSKTYDNHAFVDKQGNEFRAVVEFAPSQRLPKLRKRKDNKQGTIETDPHYAAFLAALGDASLPMPSLLGTADGAAAALNPDAALPQPTETPLVAYIREKRQNAADRKAKRAEKEAEMAKVKLLKRPGAVGAGGGKDKEKGKGAPASLLAPSKSGESGTGKGKRKGKGGAAASTAPEASTPTTDKPPNEPKKPKEKDSKRSKRGANAAAAPAPAQPSSPASATPSSEPTSQPQQPKATPKPKSSFSVVIQKADGTTSSKSLGDQPSSTPSAAEKEVKEVDVTARGVLSVDPAAIAAGKGNKSGRGGRRGGGGRGRGGGGGGAGGAGQGAGEGAG